MHAKIAGGDGWSELFGKQRLWAHRVRADAAQTILEIADGRDADAHKVLEPMAREVTRVGVRRYLDDARRQVREIDALLGEMCR